MTTPAFDPTQPNTLVTTTREEAIESTNDNFLSMRDLLIMHGSVPSWNRTPYGASKRWPDGIISRERSGALRRADHLGRQRRRAEPHRQGGVYLHSEDSGATWNPFPFDAAGNHVRIRQLGRGRLTGPATTWTNTP